MFVKAQPFAVQILGQVRRISRRLAPITQIKFGDNPYERNAPALICRSDVTDRASTSPENIFVTTSLQARYSSGRDCLVGFRNVLEGRRRHTPIVAGEYNRDIGLELERRECEFSHLIPEIGPCEIDDIDLAFTKLPVENHL